MKRKFKIPDLIIFTAVASTTFYIIFRNLPRIPGSFALLWGPVTLFTVFIIRPKYYLKEPLNILLLYALLVVGILQYTLWEYMTDFNRIRILYECFYLIVFTSIWIYYNRRGDFLGLALISKWSFIFILITLVTTNIALFVDPAIVRDSANNADFTPSQTTLFNISGALDYSYIQAVICIIPVIVFYVKSGRTFLFSRNILIMILILLIITELRSQVFANIIVTIIITILSLISSKNRLITFITIATAVFIFLVIPGKFYSGIITDLSSNFDPGSVMFNKLEGIGQFIENPDIESDTEIGRRAARYPLLFDALASNPVLGHSSFRSNMNIGAGAHLYWMNRLAIWGIPGFLFFIFVLYKIFRNVSSRFDKDFKYYYFLSLLTIMILGLVKVVGGREAWLILIVIIPGLYYLPLSVKIKGQTLRPAKE